MLMGVLIFIYFFIFQSILFISLHRFDDVRSNQEINGFVVRGMKTSASLNGDECMTLRVNNGKGHDS